MPLDRSSFNGSRSAMSMAAARGPSKRNATSPTGGVPSEVSTAVKRRPLSKRRLPSAPMVASGTVSSRLPPSTRTNPRGISNAGPPLSGKISVPPISSDSETRLSPLLASLTMPPVSWPRVTRVASQDRASGAMADGHSAISRLSGIGAMRASMPAERLASVAKSLMLPFAEMAAPPALSEISCSNSWPASGTNCPRTLNWSIATGCPSGVDGARTPAVEANWKPQMGNPSLDGVGDLVTLPVTSRRLPSTDTDASEMFKREAVGS